MKLLLFILLYPLILFSNESLELKDFKLYPQDPDFYVKNIESIENQILRDEKYNEKYFSPWKLNKITLDFYHIVGFAHQNKVTYGFNKIPIKKSWYKKQVDNMNLNEMNQVAKTAIMIKNSHIRALPTEMLILEDPYKPGEGYPFDYNQHSFIAINTPIFISHFSRDKTYVFIQSSITEGWVKSDAIAFVDENTRKQFQNNLYYISVKEGFSIFSEEVFIEKIKLGTIFPKMEGKWIIIKRNQGYNGTIAFAETEESNLMKKPISFNQDNISMISRELIGEEYGWGGILNKRDCSAMTKDFFSVFGIFLNRNSSQQLQNGKTINVKTLSNQEKKKKIIQLAKPFKTLLYTIGHIGLYIGHVKGEPIIMHNTWGIKTVKEDGSYDRYKIGRAIISSLNLGEDLKDVLKSKILINSIEQIVIF